MAGGGNGGTQHREEEIHALREGQFERRPDKVDRFAAAEDGDQELPCFGHLGFCHFDKCQKLGGEGREGVGEGFADFIESLTECGFDLFCRIRRGCRCAAHLSFDGFENVCLRFHHLVGFSERLDLFLLLIGESDARFPEGDDALDRVVERLAQRDSIGLCAAETCRPHVHGGLGGTVEIAAHFVGAFGEFLEREQLRLGHLDRSAIHARLDLDLVGHLVESFGHHSGLITEQAH